MGGDSIETDDVIDVSKSVSLADAQPLATVDLEVRNEVGFPVAVRLHDPIPDGIERAAIGFREAERERWSLVDDGTLEFSAYVAGDGTISGTYAIQDATDAVDDLRESPTVVNVQPVSQGEFDDGSRTVPAWRDGATSAAAGGDAGQRPNGDDGSASQSVEPPQDADASERDETADRPAEAELDLEIDEVDDATDSVFADTDDGSPDAERVAEDGRPDSDDYPGDGNDGPPGVADSSGGADRPSVPTSVQVRLKRIETELSEIAAYKDALEAFLDEHGSAQSIRETIREQQTSIDGVRSEVAATTERLDDVEAAWEQRATELEREVTSVRDHLEELSESIDGRLGALETDLGSLSEQVEAFADRLDEVEAAVADRDDDLADLRSTVDDLGGLATADRTAAERLEALEATQDRILTVFESVAADVPREAAEDSTSQPTADEE